MVAGVAFGTAATLLELTSELALEGGMLDGLLLRLDMLDTTLGALEELMELLLSIAKLLIAVSLGCWPTQAVSAATRDVQAKILTRFMGRPWLYWLFVLRMGAK